METFIPKILLRIEIYSFGIQALVRIQAFVDGDFHSKNLAPDRNL